ncbi:four helix bundle protein [Patescibacteria group bacterium]
MKKIQKLEDLDTWKEAIKLLKMIYSLLHKLPEEEKYNIKKHLMQCARNAPGNIAEGFGRYFSRDSVQFYRIATGSLNEIKSDITACRELEYLSKEECEKITKQIDKCLSLIYGLIRSAWKNKESSRRS